MDHTSALYPISTPLRPIGLWRIVFLSPIHSASATTITSYGVHKLAMFDSGRRLGQRSHHVPAHPSGRESLRKQEPNESTPLRIANYPLNYQDSMRSMRSPLAHGHSLSTYTEQRWHVSSDDGLGPQVGIHSAYHPPMATSGLYHVPIAGEQRVHHTASQVCHLQTLCLDKQLEADSHPQACESCRQLKVKCDEEEPCKNCRDKDMACKYQDRIPKK